MVRLERSVDSSYSFSTPLPFDHGVLNYPVLRHLQWTTNRHLSSRLLSAIKGFSARHVRNFPSSSLDGVNVSTLSDWLPVSENCEGEASQLMNHATRINQPSDVHAWPAALFAACLSTRSSRPLGESRSFCTPHHTVCRRTRTFPWSGCARPRVSLDRGKINGRLLVVAAE